MIVSKVAFLFTGIWEVGKNISIVGDRIYFDKKITFCQAS